MATVGLVVATVVQLFDDWSGGGLCCSGIGELLVTAVSGDSSGCSGGSGGSGRCSGDVGSCGRCD